MGRRRAAVRGVSGGIGGAGWWWGLASSARVFTAAGKAGARVAEATRRGAAGSEDVAIRQGGLLGSW